MMFDMTCKLQFYWKKIIPKFFNGFLFKFLLLASAQAQKSLNCCTLQEKIWIDGWMDGNESKKIQFKGKEHAQV